MMPSRKLTVFLIFLLFLPSCYRPYSQAYRCFYSHKAEFRSPLEPMKETPYFLVLLVNARHLDYTDNSSFLTTVAKHPDDRTKTGDVGHCWIYLKGVVDHRKVSLEGGHSGETGQKQARYFDGIMNYNDWGESNPSLDRKKASRYEPNPVQYLWASQEDGFFQKGSGGHVPTFAAKIDLTEDQFHELLQSIRAYSYHSYSLTKDQCCTFVAKVASLVGLECESRLTMSLLPGLWFRKRWIRLWEDPRYRTITISTPDIVEKSLIEAVREGKAEYALDWYLKKMEGRLLIDKEEKLF